MRNHSSLTPLEEKQILEEGETSIESIIQDKVDKTRSF